MNYLKATYIGNCIDIGNNKKYITKIFSDSTELAQQIKSNQKKLSEKLFLDNVDFKSIPKKALKGETEYFYFGKDLKPDEAKFFYIYNIDSDVHYFFEK